MPVSQGDQHKTTTVLGDVEAGGIALVCAEPEKKLRSNGRGRAERASSSPACCRQRSEYQRGYTVFECRLDGNQPIAQVVQVPPDTRDSIGQNKTCMISETRQSEFGPFSRVAAYPGQRSPRSSTKRSASPGPMSFLLETKDRPNGATACVGKVAECLNSSTANYEPITIIEAVHGHGNEDGPCSRLTYGPVGDTGARSSPGTYKPPAFFIECTTSPKGPLARVTQVPQGRSTIFGKYATRYETAVKHDGSCPTAKVTRSKKKDVLDVPNDCEYLEARVGASGPQARALEFPQRFSNLRHLTHLNVKPGDNGPAAATARISQHFASPTRPINNGHDNKKAIKATVCRRDRHIDRVAESSRTFGIGAENKKISDAVRSTFRRRSGLTSTSSEMEGCVGAFGRTKHGRIGQAPKSCTATSRTVSACPCVPQPCCRAMEGFRSQMHPLPGGSVFSQCPAPSLPDIAPVQLGPYRLRDYRPIPKKSGERKKYGQRGAKNVVAKRKPSEATKPSKPKKPVKPTDPDKQKIPKESAPAKKETKNKKTGRRSKDPQSSETLPEEEKELPQVSSGSSVLRRTFASVGNQSDPILREPVYVQCPAQQTESIQTQSNREEPVYVPCPAYVSQRNKSVQSFEQLSYVRCSAYESKKSSEASTTSGATENPLTTNFPDHYRAKTMQSCVACCAKRNGLQNECHLHIPENALQTSYEQRRYRHARTLISNSARRRSFMVDQLPAIEYCVRSELPIPS